MALRFDVCFSSPTINSKFPPKCEHTLPIRRSSITSFWPVHRFQHQILCRRVKFFHKGKISFTKIECSAETGASDENLGAVKEKSVSVVLLAGGKGKRMGANMPKQYLPLLGKPIALYSFRTFSQMIEVKEIVVVCDPSYKDVFEDTSEEIPVALKFALPGKERQDSVFSGFQEIDGDSKLVCIHDSARPLVTSEDIKKVLKDAWQTGAAVLGVPVKATIKEANSESYVVRTLDRKTLWEMQTPQVDYQCIEGRSMSIGEEEVLKDFMPEDFPKNLPSCKEVLNMIEGDQSTKILTLAQIRFSLKVILNLAMWVTLFGVYGKRETTENLIENLFPGKFCAIESLDKYPLGSSCGRNFRTSKDQICVEIGFSSQMSFPSRPPPMTVWSPPPLGHFKLNFDGSAFGCLGTAGFGAVIHDEKGNLLLSYAGPIGISDSTSAEFHGLYNGLKLFTQKMEGPLCVEGDSKVVINWCMNSSKPPWRH